MDGRLERGIHVRIGRISKLITCAVLVLSSVSLGAILYLRRPVETRAPAGSSVIASPEDRIGQPRGYGMAWYAAMAATALNAMIILFSLVVFFQRRVVNPVTELREKAGRLAAGDKTVRFIRENDRSEVGDLARSLEEFRVAGEILETKTAELRELNEEQRAIFDSATMGIVLLKDLVIVRCNRGLEELFGYGPGELEGKTTRCWYEDEESYLDAIHDLQHQLSESGCHRKERRLVRKDGSSFWARGKGQLLNRDDPARGLVGRIDDITTEREAAEAVVRAKEEAEEANRLKSRLVANMSHEMLTPLNAILGLTHLALKSDDLLRSRDYLLKIRESGRYLLGLINNIFDFSGTGSGRIALETEEFDLEELVCRIAKDLNEKAVCKGLEFVINIASDVPRYLVGDPLRIGQILLNFGANAVKFTEHGEICLGARVLERGGEDALICFTVRDTGIGLTREELGRLFSGFHQADMSDTRRYGGAGLGLAISKKLADLMGGGIGAESEYGKGSVFWFSARLGIGKGETASLIPSLDLRGCRILVVDDNESARAALCDMLRSMMFNVEDAPSGTLALRQAEQALSLERPYQAVLIDRGMPGMDGIETAARIRSLSPGSPPGIILMKGAGDNGRPYEGDGADDMEILTKPVPPSVLFDTIIRALSRLAGRDREFTAANPALEGRLKTIAGARILLVEDNEINREVAVELLRGAGLRVDTAGNGREALGMLNGSVYELVLMDMQMPVMDGVTATGAIRANPLWKDIPVIAMTANVMPSYREECRAAGMNDFIPKPIDPSLLWSALLKWIQPRKGDAEGPSPPESPDASLPLALDGIDTALGLRLLLDNRDLYIAILRKFLLNHGDTAAEIRHALDAGDLWTAGRIAHTMKGVAGNIGAMNLHSLAAELERGIRNGAAPEEVERRMMMFQEALDALVRELRMKLPPEEAPEPVQVDGEALEVICDFLAELLKQDDAEAVELFGENENLLRAAFPEEFGPMEKAIRRFDFDVALAILEKTRSVTVSDAAHA